LPFSFEDIIKRKGQVKRKEEVPKMPKVGKAKERKQKGKEHREKKVKGKRTKEKEFPAVGPRPFESLKVCDRAFG